MEKPNKITVAYLQCVVMPNGEIISKGKSIGFFKGYEDVLVEGVKKVEFTPELKKKVEAFCRAHYYTETGNNEEPTPWEPFEYHSEEQIEGFIQADVCALEDFLKGL
jgi:hypothetical protein